MKRLVIAMLMVGALGGAVAAVGGLGVGIFARDRLASSLMPDSLFPRCTDDDRRLASALAALSVLDARPAGAEPYGRRGGGCTDDDRLAYAEQFYRVSASRTGIPSFYRKAAIKDGWKPAPKRENEEARTCLIKIVNGRKAHLSVGYSDQPGEKSRVYSLQVLSGPSGGNLC
ncbi:hypothetical protein GCM10017673_39330 [Streptosporangium violaceochromogenes]|nr:hypothetical protein GCM10017673_39330 [Streptosporangium violaceochromogenes]